MILEDCVLVHTGMAEKILFFQFNIIHPSSYFIYTTSDRSSWRKASPWRKAVDASAAYFWVSRLFKISLLKQINHFILKRFSRDFKYMILSP